MTLFVVLFYRSEQNKLSRSKLTQSNNWIPASAGMTMHCKQRGNKPKEIKFDDTKWCHIRNLISQSR